MPMSSWKKRMSIGRASGDQSHAVTSAVSRRRVADVSCAGKLCQKLRMPKANPPPGPPM